MSNLQAFFQESGYTLHRPSARRERLPVCCRSGLSGTEWGIRFMTSGGDATVLPLVRCTACGRQYAEDNGKYLPVANTLQFDVVKIKSFGE